SDGFSADLGLVAAIGKNVVRPEPDLRGHVLDGSKLCRLRNRYIRRNRGHELVLPAYCGRGPKTRTAFRPVRAISSSTEMPRTPAIFSATCRTNAGSFRLPRCGAGAR